MSITPAGNPAWTRTADHTFYGGDVEKTNYLSRGAIDALTDVTAEAITRMAADLAAVVLTAPFAVITYTCSDSSPDDPTVSTADLMTGVTNVPYAGDAPPTGFPTAIRQGDGDVLFTFSTSYVDDYGVSGAFTPRHAVASVHGTAAATATCVISGSTVRVRAFTAAGSALSNAKVTVEVY